MCPSQVHKIGGPFLRDWSRIAMARDLRLHPLLMSKDYARDGSWSAYAYAFSTVEEYVLHSSIQRICNDLEVRRHHAPRSI